MPDSKTNWTLFVPIYNLVIDSDMGGKLTIERVTFVSSDKIPKIRRLKEPVFTKTRVYAASKLNVRRTIRYPASFIEFKKPFIY